MLKLHPKQTYNNDVRLVYFQISFGNGYAASTDVVLMFYRQIVEILIFTRIYYVWTYARSNYITITI